jgi:hypothetical protein
MHPRYFELLNFQHFMLYLWPTLVFIVLFGVGLAFTHFKGPDSERRLTETHRMFPDGIEGRNAPFPLAMVLIIAGTVIWGLGYIFFNGILGVAI